MLCMLRNLQQMKFEPMIRPLIASREILYDHLKTGEIEKT